MEETKMLCTVEMDGEVRSSDDFVAILASEDGNTSITYNTDAMTLGVAFKMIARAFVECMKECSEEERHAISEALDIHEAATPEEMEELCRE